MVSSNETVIALLEEDRLSKEQETTVKDEDIDCLLPLWCDCGRGCAVFNVIFMVAGIIAVILGALKIGGKIQKETP